MAPVTIAATRSASAAAVHAGSGRHGEVGDPARHGADRRTDERVQRRATRDVAAVERDETADGNARQERDRGQRRPSDRHR